MITLATLNEVKRYQNVFKNDILWHANFGHLIITTCRTQTENGMSCKAPCNILILCHRKDMSPAVPKGLFNSYYCNTK